MGEVKLNNAKEGGDIFSSIEFAMGELHTHCQQKIYHKRIFIFTNGMGKTNYDFNKLKNLARKLKEREIKLNIIPIDFMETYDYEDNQVDYEIASNETQRANIELLIRLKELGDSGNIQIFPAIMAIELYRTLRKKDTNPMVLFKGEFQIAPKMSISISTYKAIRRSRLQSLS